VRAHIVPCCASNINGPIVRYWIQGEDEDYEREWRRARIAGDALPADLSPAASAAMIAMVATQVVAIVALVALVLDWLRA
jgi:hypothetical protein